MLTKTNTGTLTLSLSQKGRARAHLPGPATQIIYEWILQGLLTFFSSMTPVMDPQFNTLLPK